MTATILITTRNRKEDLRRAIVSALAQKFPVRVLVLDDCSTDGTPELVRQEFPEVRLECSPERRGYIFQRNRGALLAETEHIVSIDDDAEFSTPHVVSQTLQEFGHPRIAAISIPYCDVLISPVLKTPIPPNRDCWVVSSYVGTAHAIRREVFLKLGGYRENLRHNTEERDFGIRLLQAGYVVRQGYADRVLHHVSPIRDAWMNRVLERRNDLLHAIWNVPFPHLVYHLPGTILNGLRFGLLNGCILQTIQGYLEGACALVKEIGARRPVACNTYLVFRALCRQKLIDLNELENRLPRIAC